MSHTCDIIITEYINLGSPARFWLSPPLQLPLHIVATVDEKVTIEKLHHMMGHIAPDAAKSLIKKGLVEGLTLDDTADMLFCDLCEYGKAHRKAIKKERKAPQAQKIGDEIYSDVWGPSPVQTLGGREYYTTYTDDNSCFSNLYLMWTKAENFEAYKEYEAELLRQKGVRIGKLHSDRGGEYLSKEFSNHLKKASTKWNLTVHDTPEHNGVVERLNHILLERVRSMLHASQLPKFLWGEAVKHAIYLKNRTSTKALDNKTPFEVFYGVKPNLCGLPEFGCRVFVHSPGGSKLDVQAVDGRWVGFDEESSGHHVYHPQKWNISIECSVKFDPTETEIYLPHNAPLEGENGHTTKRLTSKPLLMISRVIPIPLGRILSKFPKQKVVWSVCKWSQPLFNVFKLVRESLVTYQGSMVYYWKVFRRGIQLDDAETGVMAAITVVNAEEDELEPSYEQAHRRSDWPQWKQVIGVELENLKAAGIWEIVERPEGINVVDSKWVFRMKKDAKGKVIKWKARLVARGFTQIYGVNYFETFAPVARLVSIQIILAIAARNGWDIFMFNFHLVYLNGVLEDGEDIYMDNHLIMKLLTILDMLWSSKNPYMG